MDRVFLQRVVMIAHPDRQGGDILDAVDGARHALRGVGGYLLHQAVVAGAGGSLSGAAGSGDCSLQRQ